MIDLSKRLKLMNGEPAKLVMAYKRNTYGVVVEVGGKQYSYTAAGRPAMSRRPWLVNSQVGYI